MNKIFATMMLLLLNLNIYAADLTKNEATHLVLSVSVSAMQPFF